MSGRLFKVLSPGQTSCHGGAAKWRKGRWMPAIRCIAPCKTGYHLCRARDIVRWLIDDCEIWEAEARGERTDADYKIVVESARITKKLAWDDRKARLLACDCVEMVLGNARPQDKATLEMTIAVSRRYAEGRATVDELAAARLAAELAGSAAWLSAGSAARLAAELAGSAAWSAMSAAWTARSAAWLAAGLPSWSAARAAELAAYRRIGEMLLWYLDGEKPASRMGASE